MSSTPLFSELISVEFDVSSFRSSLDQLKSAYQSFMADLSASGLSGNDVLGAGMVADFSESIRQVKLEVNDLAASFKDAFASVGAASSTAAEKLATAQEQGGDKKNTGITKQTAQLEELSQKLQNGEASWTEFASAGRKALEDGLNPALRSSIALQEQLRQVMTGMVTDGAALTNKQSDFYYKPTQDINKGNTQADDEQNSRDLASLQDDIKARSKQKDSFYNSSSANDKKAIQEEQELRESDLGNFRSMMETKQSLTEKLQSTQVSLGEQQNRVAEAQVKMQDASLAQQAAADKGYSEDVLARYAQQVEAAKAAYQSRGMLVEQYANSVRNIEAQIADIDTRTADHGKVVFQEQIDSDIKQLQRLAAEADRVSSQASQSASRGASLNPVAEAPTGIIENIKTSMTEMKSNLGGMVGSLVEFQLEWGLASAAVSGLLAPVKAVVDIIKTGVDYTTKLQEQAADLQGVIASTTKLNDDPFKNFADSGLAAEEVVKRLQTQAAATGMSYSTLARSFKSLMVSGGGHLVGDLDQAVQLSNLLAVAMVAAGKDVQTTRMLMSDIPKLLDGSITSSSSLLKVLGLTTDQWAKMRTQAETHHDLLAQLSPLMAQYTAVIEQADTRAANLEASIKLTYEQAAALALAPMWAVMLGALEQIKSYLETHKSQFQAILSTVANLVSSLATMLLSVISLGQSTGTVATGFMGVAKVVDKVLEGVIGVADTVGFLVKTLGGGLGFLNSITDHTNWEQIKASAHSYFDQVKADAKATNLQLQDSQNRAADFANNTSMSSVNQPTKGQDLLSQAMEAKGILPTKPKKPHYDNSGIAILGDEFKKAVDDIKQGTSDYVTFIKDQIANNNVDKADGLRLIKDAHTAEKGNLEVVVEQAVQKAYSVVGANPKRVKAYQQRVTDYSGMGVAEGQADRTQVEIDALSTKRAATQSADEAKLAISELTHKIADEAANQKNSGLNKSQIYSDQINLSTMEHKSAQDAFGVEKVEAGSNKDLLEQINTKSQEEIIKFISSLSNLLNKYAEAKFNESLAPTNNTIKGDTDTLSLARKSAQGIDSAYGTGSQKADTASVAVARAQYDLANDQKLKSSMVSDYQDSLNPNSEAAAQAKQDLVDATGNLVQATKDLSAAVAKASTGQKVRKALGMPSSVDEDGNPKTGSDAVAANVTGANAVLKDVTGAVGAIKAGISQGGVLGGIGAGVSSVSGLVSAINPVAGAIVGFAGSILSTIGNMFTAQAAHIAAEIQRQYTLTMQAYQDKEQTASLTLQQVEQEKQDAITKLSGVKGGKDQLSKLLPTLDSTIAQLKQGIASTLDSFNTGLATIQSNNATGGLAGPIGAMETQWANVNKQVQAYIAAGGSASTAYQFLSESLKALSQQAETALVGGQQTAIQDAISLNNLLQQRIDLEKQQALSNFSLLTKDSLERRGSNAVTTGVALQLQQQQYNLQMQALNSQITGTQERLDLEKQIYNISGSQASLLEQSNQLALYSLNQQIEQLKQFGQIYQNIFTNANGQSSMSSYLANMLNQFTFNFSTGQINSDNWLGVIANVAQQTGDTVTNTIKRQAQYGLTPNFQQQY